jgi:hypothetical protein
MWAKARSAVPTIRSIPHLEQEWWARRKGAFTHPTIYRLIATRFIGRHNASLGVLDGSFREGVAVRH